MRLNNKTIRNYFLYSSIIFLLTTPVFYFVMRSVLLESVDKSLKAQLHEIRENLGEIRSQDEMEAWARLDKDISLSHATGHHRDTIYSTNRRSERHHHEDEPYREISGTIEFGGKLYDLIVRSSLVENDDLLGSILLVQVSMLLVLIGGMIWINHRVSRRLWQPFYVALRNMQQFELNKRSVPAFKHSTTDEFNELNKAILHLFSRSTELYQQQKEFTENASHEMQTPLAIFQSKLELLMQTSPLSAEQAGLINTLDTTNRRLVKLNKSLLLLTKIENNQYPETESIEAGAVCQRLMQQYSIHAESKRITMEGRFDHPVPLSVNPALFEILIGNLMSNAIRYNRREGRILASTSERELTIANTGVEGPLAAERIFERFHKQTGTPEGEDGTGLGLAIVQHICHFYHYTIRYTYAEGMHRFTLGFRE